MLAYIRLAHPYMRSRNSIWSQGRRRIGPSGAEDGDEVRGDLDKVRWDRISQPFYQPNDPAKEYCLSDAQSKLCCRRIHVGF